MHFTDRDISTERLLLRPFREEDLDRLAALQSRPEVSQYLHWEPRSREESAAALARYMTEDHLEEDDDPWRSRSSAATRMPTVSSPAPTPATPARLPSSPASGPAPPTPPDSRYDPSPLWGSGPTG